VVRKPAQEIPVWALGRNISNPVFQFLATAQTTGMLDLKRKSTTIKLPFKTKSSPAVFIERLWCRQFRGVTAEWLEMPLSIQMPEHLAFRGVEI